ncbi:hypothetical protein ABIA33_005693 [Streptacidiphilus sp. MAP12-16]|uniref:hypothetical protein n=1 Tax=Streptacidiphilus sp. MAP12-16 TaxID=3156300 RepID=UPI003519D585
MRIHRTAHARHFTVLPNALLQDRRLSYTARGLLGDLLTRPDGWREDGRQMADRSPQGRLAVSRALRELTQAGYYRVDKVRQPDGTFISEAHVWDTPQQLAPDLTRPGSGAVASGDPDCHPVKDYRQEPSLPASQTVGQPRSDRATPGPTSTAVNEAVAVLFRAIRPEPRLRLGTVEALELAPLVAAWLERGCSQADLSQALLPGLPARMHSAAGLLRDRLVRKLPPVPEPSVAPTTRWFECGACGDPVPRAGICRSCAGLGTPPVRVGGGETTTARGMAKVRAAMRPIGGLRTADAG